MNKMIPAVMTCCVLFVPLFGKDVQGEGVAGEETTDTAGAADVRGQTADTTDEPGPATEKDFEKRTTITITDGPGDSGDVVVVRETSDTVYVVSGSDVPRFMKDTHLKSDALRTKGFGIAGGPMPGVYAINMSPVRKLTESAQPFLGKTFDFGTLDYHAFRTRGGMGYVGLGNGLRIGGGGSGGKADITSERYQGDSVMVLKTRVGFGGFLIEKGFVKKRFNYSLGGYIGGGSFKIDVTTVDLDSVTAFSLGDNLTKSGEIEADFMLIEGHGGFTFTIVPFFHIGLGISLPAFISTNGFSSPAVTYSSEFFTLNPGVNIKFVFGNLG